MKFYEVVYKELCGTRAVVGTYMDYQKAYDFYSLHTDFEIWECNFDNGTITKKRIL